MYALRILDLVRNGDATDWLSLCRALGVSPNVDGTAQNMAAHNLKELVEVGFIQVAEWPGKRGRPRGRITIGMSWPAVQSALGVSLTRLRQLESSKAMAVYPFYGPPPGAGYRPEVFVIMSFDDDLEPVYQDHIRKVVKSLRIPIRSHLASEGERGEQRVGLVSVRRADDFFTVNTVMDDVWASICAAKVVIADCTRRNANVFYELGLTHAVGTPVILISQDSADIPFDVRHIRYIRYEYTPRGMKMFEGALKSTLLDLLEPIAVASANSAVV